MLLLLLLLLLFWKFFIVGVSFYVEYPLQQPHARRQPTTLQLRERLT